MGDQFLTLEIADNVRIKVQRFQVTSLVPKGTLKGSLSLHARIRALEIHHSSRSFCCWRWCSRCLTCSATTPRLQFARKDHDGDRRAELSDRRERSLKQAGVASRSASSITAMLIVRFADVTEQLKAPRCRQGRDDWPRQDYVNAMLFASRAPRRI